MRFLRRFEWTIRVCSILVKDAASFPLLSFLPPLVTIASYLALHRSGVAVPLAFVSSYALGFAFSVWLRMSWLVQELENRKWPLWLIILYPIVQIGLVIMLESPSAALRVAYIYIALRITILVMDMADGSRFFVRRLWPGSRVLAHEGTLTRVLFLRDAAMILFAETIILVGSVPLMLTALAFWPMLHRFIDRIVVVSVLLVCENEKGR